jgi:hypothetical protein
MLSSAEPPYPQLNGNKIWRKRESPFVRDHFEGALPSHFIPTFDRNRIADIKSTSNSTMKRRVRKSNNSYLIFFDGYCRHKEDKCTPLFYAGIEQSQIELPCQPSCVSIETSMNIMSQCCHKKGKTFNDCRGKARQKRIKDRIDWNFTKRPSELSSQSLAHVSKEGMVTGNHGADGVTHLQEYEINREAKEEVKKCLGLGSDKLANIIHASSIINENDTNLCMSKNPPDNSNDKLGFLRHGTFHDSLCMHLFTKDQLLLFIHLLDSQQLALYYDASGEMLSLQGCGSANKILLHSMLSFSPCKHFLDAVDRKFDSKLFRAYVLAEHIAHR